MLGHAVACDGAHDHPLREHRLVDARSVAYAHRDEIAEGRDVLEAEALEARGELRETGRVHRTAPGDEFGIVQCRARRDHREVIHVERLAHAVHQFRDFRMRDPVAHAQSREAERLGERA